LYTEEPKKTLVVDHWEGYVSKYYTFEGNTPEKCEGERFEIIKA
jgi:hypothetical protein